jgi:transcriptional regulator with XRE-family HTH domain
VLACLMYSVRHGKLRRELAVIRVAAGMNQRQLAAKLKRPPSYVGKVETGERRIEVFEAVDWCAACGVELAAVLKRVRD